MSGDPTGPCVGCPACSSHCCHCSRGSGVQSLRLGKVLGSLGWDLLTRGREGRGAGSTLTKAEKRGVMVRDGPGRQEGRWK